MCWVAASGILLLVLGTAIPLVPSVVYWSRHGRNPVLAYKTRAPDGAEGGGEAAAMVGGG